MKPAGWPERLAEFADGTRGVVFEWGKTDCIALALRAIGAIYQADYTEIVTWSTQAGAIKASKTLDVDRWLEDFGAAPVLPGFIQSGDVLIGRADPFPAAHVVLDRRALTAYIGGFVEFVPVVRLLEGADLTAWRLP